MPDTNTPMNPECEQGKHGNCDTTALVDDAFVDCGCECHGSGHDQ